MHPRTLIRHTIRDRLLAANTAAGSRVVATRMDSQRPSELPAISVYTLDEPATADDTSAAPREYARDLEVWIIGWVAHTSAAPADDAADDLAAQVEAVMDADPYLGGAAADSVLERTEIGVHNEGDPLYVRFNITYRVEYRTSPTPPSNLADFLTARTTTAAGSATVDNAASDVIQVRP